MAGQAMVDARGHPGQPWRHSTGSVGPEGEVDGRESSRARGCRT